MKIIKLTKANKDRAIKEAIKVLAIGGIVVYPTETCYGAGVDAVSQNAVNKILQYKDRLEGKAVSIAVYNEKMAQKYIKVNKTARNLYKNFLPGPLTIISKSRAKTAKGLETESAMLGVRIPNYPFTLELIKKFGRPITATSANASYKKTPYCVDDILKNTTKKQQKLIGLILDAGQLQKNPPSTVVDTTLNEIEVLRKGKMDLLKVQSEKLKVKSLFSKSENETQEIAVGIMKNLHNKFKDECIIFALQGELGAGKTQFAKGVARALKIKENVTSPTFVLLREYQFSNRTMFHIDTWRMREAQELLDLSFNKMLKTGNVIVIEWLEKVKKVLEKIKTRKNIKIIWVDMKYKSENERIVQILL